MRFDLVALNESYRGIDRSLSPYDFVSKKAKKNYNELISCYFEYTELMCSPEKNPYNSDTFNDLLEYYKKFKGYDVNCEIIVYDSEPLEDAFGKQIQLLGIDVVCRTQGTVLCVPPVSRSPVSLLSFVKMVYL